MGTISDGTTTTERAIMRVFARGRGFARHKQLFTNGHGIFSGQEQIAGRNKFGIWILPRGTMMPTIDQTKHLELVHKAFPFANVGSLHAKRVDI